MEETWNTFWETGKVNDYLKVCEEREEQEVRQNGTKPDNDRHGFKCDANWRI